MEWGRIESEELIQLDAACSHWANAPEVFRRLFGLCPTVTTEAIHREPERMTTGATAAPTPIDQTTAYPGGGS